MRSVMILALVALAAAARQDPSGVHMKEHPLLKLKGDEAATASAFKSYVSKHELMFAGEEYGKRLSIFKDNIKIAIEHAEQDPTAEHGITKFAHLSQEEFAASYLGKPFDPVQQRKGMTVGPKLDLTDVPEDFDWREKGAVSQVKNQGQCGSCWSFSTTGAIEGSTMVKTGKLPNLSEQMLVDCDHNCFNDDPNNGCDAGCNGGLPANAMKYVQDNGIDTEESYPYEAVDGECRKSAGTIGGKVTNFTLVPNDEDQMKAYMYANGPLSIGIDATWMQSYMGGVSCPWMCNPKMLDHGVLIVAYGKEAFAPMRLSEQPYWVIKNSWGPSWGEDGFIRICRGKNMCGLNEMVVSVTEV